MRINYSKHNQNIAFLNDKVEMAVIGALIGLWLGFIVETSISFFTNELITDSTSFLLIFSFIGVVICEYRAFKK